MPGDAVLGVVPLGFPWQTLDPFLFCAHHDDAYPAGNEDLGPAASLEGRTLGQDFTIKDGWRMYHGQTVPGFPSHPHRGFETVTLVRRGYIDHTDSLGAAARFGEGDVQWITAGEGIVHAEMFPLLDREGGNPLELFQIWLNLPSGKKMVAPYFSMLWSETLPRLTFRDDAGGETVVLAVAGAPDGHETPAPPPDSWAAAEGSEVAIWAVTMAPGARWALPAVSEGVNRVLYFYEGASLRVDGQKVGPRSGVQLRPGREVPLVAGPAGAELLLLQGRPIGEPVAQHGPFVMNTRSELQQAFVDYQQTRFGGWPWPSDDPVLPRQEGRFARYPDGRVERPG